MKTDIDALSYLRPFDYKKSVQLDITKKIKIENIECKTVQIVDLSRLKSFI